MRSKTSDAGLINLFLDMLAAEQGAGRQHAGMRIAAILRIFRNFSPATSRTLAGRRTQALRDYLADLDTRGFKSSSVARRLSAMRHLFRFLLHERIRSDDPAAILSGPKRGRGLPKVLSISDVDRLLGVRQGAGRCAGSLCVAAASRAAIVLLLEVLYATGLRVVRTGLVAARASRRDARNDRGPRQGQQGAAGTAERAIATGDGRLSCGDGSAEAGEKETMARPKNGSASKWLVSVGSARRASARQHFARD